MSQTARPAQPPLLVIVGPTAVGKSDVSIRLAQASNGEIVCADSRTQYRGMDIGAAKPTAAQRALVAHHLLDIIAPDEHYSLAQFQVQAYAAMAAISARGCLPLLVGGSGLYVKAVVEGFRIPQMAPDLALRQSLADEATRRGIEHLYAELQRVDPEAARRIEPTNVRRVIRALEVFRQLGVPISQLQQKQPPPYRIVQLGLTRPMASLERRISARVDAMLADGLVDEVRGLVQRGYGYDLPAMSGIGYREIGMYLRGEVDLQTARGLIVRNTRRFVRRQYQWFRLNDPALHWIDLDEPGAEGAIQRALAAFGLAQRTRSTT